MKNIILCSSNALLVKSLYGILRDEGHCVETTEHPAFAVQKIIHKSYDFLIIDSEPFGLSAEDAAEIIKNLAPGTEIIFVGKRARNAYGVNREALLDLEKIKRTIHGIAP